MKQGYHLATLTSNPHHLALVQVASTTQLAVTCCHELSVNFEQLSNCTPFICYLLSTSVQCKELLLPQKHCLLSSDSDPKLNVHYSPVYVECQTHNAKGRNALAGGLEI